MAENTLISWAHDTFNPWEGCTRISAACDHCYAAERAHRFGNDHLWAGHLRRTSPSNWRKPLKWNREAAASGKPRRVFCASLADVFDNQAPQAWRDELWALIEATPHLTWMLLTKRPQKIVGMLPPAWLITPRHNVWYGTTVEDQTRADQRIPHLLATPAAVRFLSCEPLLSPIDLTDLPVHDRPLLRTDVLLGVASCGGLSVDCPKIDWVIVGGESGPGARPMHAGWARSIRDQCAAAGVTFHFKQWGEWADNFPFWTHDPTGKPFDGATGTFRVGNRAAGRLLDGVRHDGMPGQPKGNPVTATSLGMERPAR